MQIIEICNSVQEKTGGLMYLDQVLDRIRKTRNRFVNEVSLDDCRRAIKKLHIFGNAFTLISMNNGRFMVQSLPEGMGVDHTEVVQLAEMNQGVVDKEIIMANLKWDSYRIENALNLMLKEGIVWIDINTNSHKSCYYFPSFFIQ